MEAGQELRFDVDGLTYAALAWGDPQLPVVLALHGWLDNALSFQFIAPRLKHYRVVAVDLSGHGHSSHRSLDATYNIWDDLPQLTKIVAQLSDGPIHVMGHSRGATIAAMLAAVLGECCSRLVMIDGLMPSFMDQRNAGVQLRNFVREREKYLARPERFFDSIDSFAQRRKQYGFSVDNAYDLAPRSLVQTEQGYRLLTDPRLFGASATWIDTDKRAQIYGEISAPVLAILGEEGMLTQHEAWPQLLQDAGACIKNFRSITLPGSHHLHMEDKAEGLVAQRIEQFLATGQ